MLFPDPAVQFADRQLVIRWDNKSLRFPWIHRRDPIDVQSLNIVP